MNITTTKPSSQEEGSDSEVEESHYSDDGTDSVKRDQSNFESTSITSTDSVRDQSNLGSNSTTISCSSESKHYISVHVCRLAKIIPIHVHVHVPQL